MIETETQNKLTISNQKKQTQSVYEYNKSKKTATKFSGKNAKTTQHRTGKSKTK